MKYFSANYSWYKKTILVAAVIIASLAAHHVLAGFSNSTAICGNGIVEAGEQCDDGNTSNGDSCSNICTILSSGTCGNGICEDGENGSTCPQDCNGTSTADLTIMVSTAGARPGITSFPFTGNVPGLSSIDFDTSSSFSSGVQSFSGLPIQSYVIQQSPADPNYMLSSIDCTGGAIAPVVDLANHQVTLDMSPGDVWSCGFPMQLNGGVGNLQITKASLGGTGSFDYTVNGPDGYTDIGNIATVTGSSLGGLGSTSFYSIPAGSYQLTETSMPPGWVFGLVNCVEEDGVTYTGTNITDGKDNITVKSGETTTCTVTNTLPPLGPPSPPPTPPPTAQGTLTIHKILEGSGVGGSSGTFGFTVEPAAGGLVTFTPFSQTAFASVTSPGSTSITPISTPLGAATVRVTESGLPAPVNPSTNNQDWSGDTANSYCTTNAPQTGGAHVGTPYNFVDTTATNPNKMAIDQVPIIAGYDTDCWFYNQPATATPTTTGATLRIVKNAIGGLDGQGFTFTGYDSTQPGGGPVEPQPFTYPFIITTNGSSSLKTGHHDIAGLVTPGTYHIYEDGLTFPANWSITGSSCDNGEAPNAVTISAADISVNKVITCTFTNTYTAPPGIGKLQIIKDTFGGPGGDVTFNFTGNTSYNPVIVATVPGSVGSGNISNDMAPGIYNIAETPDPNWTQTSAYCDNGNPLNAIAISAGQTVTCYISNTYKTTTGTGTLIVKKISQGGDGNFNFSLGGLTGAIFPPGYTPPPSSFSIATTGASGSTPGTGQSNPLSLIPADATVVAGYSVGEINPPNSLTTVDCQLQDGTPTGNQSGTSFIGSITIQSGKTTTCTFTNFLLPTGGTGFLVIKKISNGGDGDFNFSFGSSGLITVSTTGSSGSNPGIGQTNPITLSAASGTAGWSVFENVPNGWSFGPAQADCVLQDGITHTGNPTATGTTNVTIEVGKTTTCTFVDTQSSITTTGQLVIKKTTHNGDGVFSYTVDSFPQSLATSGSSSTKPGSGQTKPLTLSPASTYDVTELVPSGWTLNGAHCQLQSGTTTGTFATDTVSGVAIEPGKITTCTFDNTQTTSGISHIIIDKDTNPSGDPQSFNFTSNFGPPFSLTDTDPPHDSGPLAPGTYSVTEGTTSGWTQTSATCSDGSSPNAISLGSGETVTCTFVNTNGSTSPSAPPGNPPNKLPEFYEELRPE